MGAVFPRDVREAVAHWSGHGVVHAEAMVGGDTSSVFVVDLESNQRVFLKVGKRNHGAVLKEEAWGLRWLREAQAIRLPECLEQGESTEGTPFLILEYVTSGQAGAGFDDTLGRALADLHRAGAPGWGLFRNNFIGPLPQDNQPGPDWATFYRERRLEPLLRKAVDRGLVDVGTKRQMFRLFQVLEQRVGPPEPPSRLHGDLWGGNLMVDEEGEPCLVDPCVYGGHREMDLAMMQLFGGFGQRVFTAYHEAHPLRQDWQARVPLYQLYPILVHVNLFGGSYVRSLSRALDAVV